MPLLTEFEEFLLDRIDYWKTNDPIKIKDENIEKKKWWDKAYNHLIEHFYPMTKNNGETFIQYWPVKFFTGEKKEYKRAYYEDKHYLNVSGIFGTGYIAMTIENLYIVCLGELTKDYPLHHLGLKSFASDVFLRMQGEVNQRKPLLEDKIYKIFMNSIINAQIALDEEGDVVDLRTKNQKFLFFAPSLDITEDIVNCIEYVISGKLDKLLINENQDSIDQLDVMEKLRKLKKLFDEDIISKEEFEEKKKEYLSQL
mgnify:CR=1 FL=1